MNWSYGDDKNRFLRLKLSLEAQIDELTTPNTPVNQKTLTATEKQELPDIGQVSPKDDLCC